jgi:polysaccharide transporter, PST family
VPALRHEAPLYAASFLTVVGTAFFPVWFFQGIEQLKFVTIGQSTARLLSLPVMFLLVRHGDDYPLAALIQGGVPVAAALIIAPVVWMRIRIDSYWPSMRDIHSCLREGWHLFVSNGAMYLFCNTTVVLLGVVAGNTEVGYYSAADKLIRAGNALMNPITQALYPHLNSLRMTSNEAALHLIRKSLALVGGATLFASAATFLLAGPISHLLLGSRFGPSVIVLQCMSPLLFLLGVSNILGTQTMLVFGLDALVSRIILVSALVSSVSTLLLANRWGAPGAAAATAGSALLMTILMIGALRRAKLAVWRVPREAACVG